MRIVACPSCHVQHDVSKITRETFECRGCESPVKNLVHAPVDAVVLRCASCGASVGPEDAVCGYCSSAIEREARKLSLICPECYARNPERAQFCASCGLRFDPRPVLGEEQELACPCCEKPMNLRPLGGLMACECRYCQGLWVPGEQFDGLVDRALAAMRASPSLGIGAFAASRKERTRDWSVRYRRCPVCAGVMQRKNFAGKSGVIVDWCGRDGTWLDADELEDIASFILSGGMEAQQGGTGASTTAASMAGSSAGGHDALVAAEHLMAEERTRSRGAMVGRRIDGSGLGSFVGDMLTHLLDW